MKGKACLSCISGLTKFADSVIGWSSLITAVLIIGSVKMIFLGILGEYVGRLFVEAKSRPLFIIDAIKIHNDEPISKRSEATLKKQPDLV
jgi:hypothetical protein